MVVRLIVLIIAIVLFAFYTGFNLDNKSNIWLFIKTYENVPVFMNSLISFGIGVLCSLPFALVRRAKTEKRVEEKERQRQLRKQAKEEAKKNNSDEKSGTSKRNAILNKIQSLKTNPEEETSITEITPDTALESVTSEDKKSSKTK